MDYEINLIPLKEEEKAEIGKVVALINGTRYYVNRKGQPPNLKTEENLIDIMYNIIRENPERTLTLKLI